MLEEKDIYEKAKLYLGITRDAIVNQEIGIVLMAAGDSSRLMAKGPKALHNLYIPNNETLLKIFILRIKSLLHYLSITNIDIPIFIIISNKYKDLFKEYFK